MKTDHNLWEAPTEPPLEQILDGQGLPTTSENGLVKLWPTRLMVCSQCFEVQLWSYSPEREPQNDAVIFKMRVINPGVNSRCTRPVPTYCPCPMCRTYHEELEKARQGFATNR